MSWQKLLSGRFLLTVACGIVFTYCAIKQIKLDEAQAALMTAVFALYFTRSDRSNGNTIPK